MSTDAKQVEKDVRALIEEADELRGLGDVISRVTKKLGIKECGGCKKRREKLNEWVPFKKKGK